MSSLANERRLRLIAGRPGFGEVSDGSAPQREDLGRGLFAAVEQVDVEHRQRARDTILVVTDRMHDAAALRRTLRFAHYKALATTDVEHATTLAPQADLVVLTVQTASLSVLGLVRWLREDDLLHRLPIIVVLSPIARRANERDTVAGADETVLAPPSDARLLAVIDTQLNAARLRQEGLHDTESQLQAVIEGLIASNTVGTATGILMGRLNIGPAQARERLAAVSTATGRPVLEVAEQVIARQSRAFPPPTPSV